MTVKVIKGADRSWRPFRFPPRVKTPAQAAAGFADDPAALQRAVAAKAWSRVARPAIAKVSSAGSRMARRWAWKRGASRAAALSMRRVNHWIA